MKAFIVILAVVIVAGGVGFVVVNNQDDKKQANSSEETVQTGEDAVTPQESEDADDVDPNNYTEGAAIGESIDATDQSEVTVSINDNIFETTYLKIKKGTKVTWANNGNVAHDVTSAATSPNGGLGSPLLSNGETYEFTFAETGIYEYFCTPHPIQMRGVITVVE